MTMTTRNSGGGLTLPPADGGEARKNTAPIPEIADGGEWSLVDVPAIQSAANLANFGSGGIMYVPLTDDSDGAALVRAHELIHARITPRNMPDAMVNDFAVQLAEDCRVWRTAESVGIDCTASIAPDGEWDRRILDGPPDAYLLGMAVATAGTGDGAKYAEALKRLRSDALEILSKAEAIRAAMLAAGEFPTFADTLAAADCIRENRAPAETETPEPDGDGEAPGDGDGSESGSGGTEKEPSDGDAGTEGEPSDGDGDGDGSGEAPGDGSPGGGGGGYKPPTHKPRGAEKAKRTKQLRRDAKKRAEAIDAAKHEAEAADLTPAEKAAGRNTAESLLERNYMHETEGPEAGAMTVKNVPLPHRLPARMRGTNFRSATYGGKIGTASRVNTDGALFRHKRMSTGGGTVLIDCSGSMRLTEADVLRILEVAPAATIATYSASPMRGELRVIAKNGRRADASELIPPGGCNVIDVPALEWLGRQSSRPRVWVCDGAVTGIGDGFSGRVSHACARLARKYGIHRVGTVNEVVKLGKKRS